jgi:hypothetical protein
MKLMMHPKSVKRSIALGLPESVWGPLDLYLFIATILCLLKWLYGVCVCY